MTSEDLLLYISLVSSTMFIIDEILGWSSCAANCISQAIVHGFCIKETSDDSTSMTQVVIM